MGSQDELRTTFKEVLDKREPVRPLTHGLLGDGLGNLWVSNDADNRVWFRKNGQTSQLTKVHCWNARAVYGAPVICGYTTEQPTFYQVLTWDREQLESGWAGMSGVPRHGETHTWADTLGGDDPVMIWTRALMPFRVSPQTTPDLTVQIQGPEVYLWLTGWQEWLGDALVDLTASVPGAGLGLHRYTLVYIDGATSTAGVLDGAAVAAAVPLPPGSWPAPPSGSIPVGLAHLSSDQTTITEDDIVDGRVIVGSAGGSVTPAAHHLIDTIVHDDTEVYALPVRGEVIRFTTDWERYDASTLGGVLIGDGTDVISDTTPTFVGVTTHNAGITMGGASGVNELTIPGNQAIAFELLDTNAVEHLRIDTAPQLEVIWNFGEADIDFRVAAGGGISDPTDAFFVEGATGRVFMGDVAAATGHLAVKDAAVSTAAQYTGLLADHTKVGGVTDQNDHMYGANLRFEMDQVGGLIGNLYGVIGEARLDAGTVGTGTQDVIGGNFSALMTGGTASRHVVGFYCLADLNAGTVALDVRGVEVRVDVEPGMTSIGRDIFGAYIWVDADEDPVGLVYNTYMTCISNVDYCLYQAGGSFAPSYLKGNLAVGATVVATAQLHVHNTAVQPVALFNQADVSEEMFEFVTTIGVGNAIEAVGGKTLTTTHFVKVTLPGALTRYFPVGTIA